MKSSGKGEPTKIAILWTPKLTPHALHVIIGPNKVACLLCRGKERELQRVRLLEGFKSIGRHLKGSSSL